ncbi:hypothetical protein [Viridibacillus arvi]|uniref:hypothetical protein n=1 Tax=Viridibacillus arvi TaxID=263475 RepID=UPI0034CFBC86
MHLISGPEEFKVRDGGDSKLNVFIDYINEMSDDELAVLNAYTEAISEMTAFLIDDRDMKNE